ncbi:MAG: hypothetical protein ACRC1I_01775 [Pseudomonas proteolytica]|uniref:hypothetical protein n=1 Tax=Pseudomonas proteolytica TaxID=219574 RepID=UPI003F3B52CF
MELRYLNLKKQRAFVGFEVCIGLKGLEDGVSMTSSTGVNIANETELGSEGLFDCLQ